MAKALLLIFSCGALWLLAQAACPNACSGHGTCGEYDSCSCYTGFEGADCSLRSCPSYKAWVTTAQGDLNFDGDTNDATIYDSDHYFTSMGVDYLKTQTSPGGSWEKWPSVFNKASVDEGHFYMECANRGICNRESGICKCFPGYIGVACRRTVCEKNCNGHGRCRSVNDQKGTYTYQLWDGEMSRSCVCDAGYTGPSCAERMCPMGNDPLTTDDDYETQWVDVYSDYSTTEDRSFAGYIRLKFTDSHGEAWETDQIAVVPYNGTSAPDMATDVAAALNALPNDVLSGVSVTQGYCESVIPGNVKIQSDALVNSTNGATIYASSGSLLRVPASSIPDTVFYNDNGFPQDDSRPTRQNLTGITNIDDTTAYLVTHQYCVRFKVSFLKTPGDLSLLTVDTSEVTIGGENTNQGAVSIGASVTDKSALGVSGVGGIAASYTHPSQVTKTCNGAAGCGIGVASRTIDVNSGGDAFVAGAKITVTCNTNSLGTYTVSNTSATGITVIEAIPSCSLGSSEDIVISLASYIIKTNADLTNLLLPGARMNIDTFSGVTPTVDFIQWDSATGAGRVFLTGEHKGNDANNAEVLTDPTSDNVYYHGIGTTESSECSDRGLCNRETGLCKCFKGYTGGACETQNALVA